MVWESVDLNHEFPLIVDVQDTSFIVVFGSEENANHHIGIFVGNNVDSVGEWLVVQSVLTSLDDDVFFDFAYSDSAADVDVEVIEVSDEFVDVEGIDFDAWEDEFFALVIWKVALVSQEDLSDGCQDAVVQRVTENGFVVFHYTRSYVVTVVMIDDVSEELNGQSVQFSVVFVVDGFDGGLDHVSEDIDTLNIVDGNFFTLFGVNVSQIDGVDDSSFEVLDQPDFVGVELVGFEVVRADWEVLSIGVTKARVISVFDFVAEAESVDVGKIVRETFQKVTSQDLLVVVIEEFTATFGMMIVGHVHPERVIQMEVVVVCVKSDIFGEVSETVFGMCVKIVIVVVLVFIIFDFVFVFLDVLVVVIVEKGVEEGLVDGDDDFFVGV